MKLIWCSSPFHIVTAINMKEKIFFDKPVSVILTDYSADSRTYYDIMTRDKRFEKIIYVPSKDILEKFNRGNALYRLFYFGQAESYLRKYGIGYEEIDELIFSYRDQIAKAIAICARKKGHYIKFSYYDDGTGSYIGSAISSMPSRLELALGVPVRFFVPDNIYLYAPKLCKDYDNLKIKQLPAISEPDAYEKYRSKEIINNEKVVFLDQYPHNEALLKLLSEWAEEIIIKKHPKCPNEDKYKEYGFAHIWSNLQPFELSLMEDDCLENRVFITECSTASMTPKILYNKEPFVIFLREMAEYRHQREYEEIDGLIYRFREIYEDKRRVYIPKTINEFKKIMDTVLRWQK